MGARPDDLGPCWWAECTSPGARIVTGVPVAPVGGKEIAAAAARITRLGLVACADHASQALTLAGAR